MSIFSWIISIGSFFAKLLSSVEKDYKNLEPKIKALLDAAIKFGNATKQYLANPGSAGPLGSVLITIGEQVLGTGIMSVITSVINEALIDCGILETALTDPAAAYQALLDHLATFKNPVSFGKELFKIVSTIALKVTELEDNNEVMAIIAIAYKLFFSTAPVVAVAQPQVVPVAQQVEAPVVPASISGIIPETTSEAPVVPNEPVA